MSIIDDLKLAMIPTAWKDEKLYSAIPSETTQTQVFDINEVQAQGGTPATYLQIDTVNEEFTVLAGSDFSYIYLTGNDNKQFRGKEYTVNITYTQNGNTSTVRLYGQNNLQAGDLVDGQNTKTFVMDGHPNGNDVRLRVAVFSNTTDITFSNISIAIKQTENMLEKGEIQKGMIAKVKACQIALKKGVNKVHIISGKTSHSLLLEVFTDKGIGTQVIK